jgi:hypothetical protein
MTPEAPLWTNWDSYRTGGCRCPIHRPDLHHNHTSAVPTCFAGFTLPNTNATMTWPGVNAAIR